MSMKLDIDIEGEKTFSRQMDRLITVYGKDLRPALKVVRDWWYTAQRAQFDSEGGFLLGQSWPELNDKYREWKLKNYGAKPILQMRGNLFRAVTGQSGHWENIDKKEMKIGISNIPYWHRHDKGTYGMPQRKYRHIGKNAKTLLNDRLREFIVAKNREIFSEAGIKR